LDRTNVEIGGRTSTGQFIKLSDQFGYTEVKYVSHWMPLPQKPEEKDGKATESPS
jgi:hypothetical protein